LIFVEDGANVDERSAVESIFMCDPFNFLLLREGIMSSRLRIRFVEKEELRWLKRQLLQTTQHSSLVVTLEFS